MSGLTLDRYPCYEHWPGCAEAYHGGHACLRMFGHAGRHQCACGATRSGGAS